MGLIFLVTFGIATGGASLYWAHGVKTKDGYVFAKVIKQIQLMMDDRRKDRD